MHRTVIRGIEIQKPPPTTTAEQVQAGASKSESQERNSKFWRENPPTNHQEDLQTLGPYTDLIGRRQPSPKTQD